MKFEMGVAVEKVELKINESSQRVDFWLVKGVEAAQVSDELNFGGLSGYFEDLSKFSNDVDSDDHVWVGSFEVKH